MEGKGMKRKIAVMLGVTMAMGLFAGCGAENSETSSGGTVTGGTETGVSEKEKTDGTADTDEIHIWHDGDETIMQVIEDQVNDSLAEDHVTVKFEKKSGLTDQIKLYGNDAESGPDMYLYAHDSLGTFVEMGVLAPITDVIDESVYADMLPMTQEAGQYKEEQYLLPVYFETLLFMYNKDTWEGEVPSTTEDLYSYMEAHTDTDRKSVV